MVNKLYLLQVAYLLCLFGAALANVNRMQAFCGIGGGCHNQIVAWLERGGPAEGPGAATGACRARCKGTAQVR